MPHDIEQILTRLSPGKFDATRAANFDIERAKGVLESSFSVERMVKFDDAARTAEFSFGTNEPIEHWFGMLQLDVSKKAVIADRVKGGVAPFLVNHNRDQHCGVIVKDSLELGSSIRGMAKFSRSQLGEDMFNDVKDEIRVGTSLGFLVHDLELLNEKEVRSGAIPQYKATKWEILEVSLASIPADIGCGSTRAFEKEQVSDPHSPVKRALSTNGENTMTPEEQAAADAAATRTAAPAPVVGTPSPEAEFVARTKEIVAFAEIFGQADLARTMLAASKDVTLDDVRAAIQAERAKTPSVKVPGESPEAIAARAGVKVELARSLPRYGRLKNFTGNDAAERAYRFGQWFLAARGLAANKLDVGPFARAAKFCETHGIEFRAMSEGVNESGGNLVPDEFGNDLIDLREVYGVFRRNAKMVPMSSDSRSDPRRDGGLTAYFEGEGDAITASDMSWGRVTLAAEKLAVLARYSSEVNEDALINFGDTLAGEIAYAFALKEDQCGFIGDGSSTYGGMQGVATKIKGLSGTIANIAGLVVATGTGYATTYGATVLSDFEAVVGKLPVYADTGRARWFMSKSYYWNVAKRLELASGGVTAKEVGEAGLRQFLGYPVEIVQVMPKNPAVSQVCALLGDLSLAASFGTRRDTTIAISEHSRFANDQIEIRGTERFDINVHDVGNASATAALRVEGPIVGLITAAS